MKILAIDTATEACSVALFNSSLDASAPEKSIDELSLCDGLFEVCPQQHSQQILPMIETLLRKHNISVAELDAVAYARGPGSFTGVRIAASTVQGLALGANLPVIQVSTLAVMAQETFLKSQCKYVVSSIDARMEEVYLAVYALDNESKTMKIVGNEVVLNPTAALAYIQEKVSSAGDNIAFNIAFAGTGFATYNDVFSAYTDNEPPKVLYPNAKYILPLAVEAIKNKDVQSVENVTPIYVRDTVTWKKLPNKV